MALSKEFIEAWMLNPDGTVPPLDPELEEHMTLDGELISIKHPLVYSIMHTPMSNGRVNAQLRLKKEAINDAIAANDFESFISLHERPYRLQAFLQVHFGMTDQEYWEHLSYLWMDTENLWQEHILWRAAIGNPKRRGRRHHFMMGQERNALTAMRSPLRVYRGTSAPDQMGCGLSWTLDKDRATWFAARFANLRETEEPIVLTGTVMKSKVVAYFLGRGEDEIVVLPEDVNGKEVIG